MRRVDEWHDEWDSGIPTVVFGVREDDKLGSTESEFCEMSVQTLADTLCGIRDLLRDLVV